MMEEKVVAGKLIAPTHWHNLCIKVMEITGIYKSIGEESLNVEIFDVYILYLQEKQKEKNVREKRKRLRRRK